MELQNFSNPTALLVLRIGLSAFFTILFIQSGFDKLFNFRENMSYIVSHFSKTSISGLAPLLFVLLTISESLAGLVSAYGIVELIIHDNAKVALLGAMLSMLSLLFVFFGQRIAKDYGGASGLAGYFLVSIAALVLLS
jgi:hypothetical protein